jgi:hypothetical protein
MKPRSWGVLFFGLPVIELMEHRRFFALFAFNLFHFDDNKGSYFFD